MRATSPRCASATSGRDILGDGGEAVGPADGDVAPAGLDDALKAIDAKANAHVDDVLRAWQRASG